MSFCWHPDVLTEVVDFPFGSAEFTAPAEFEIALWVGGNPFVPADGAAAVEMSGSGYARVTVPNDGTMWSPGVIIRSLQEVSWPMATAQWPLIRHLVFIDKDVIPGRLMAVMSPIDPITIANGDTLTAAIGDLEFHWGFADIMSSASPPASSGWTDVLATGVWNRMVGADTSWTPPYQVEFSLWTGDPYYGGTEVVGTGYARLSRSNGSSSDPTWHMGSPVKTNRVPLRWPASGVAGTDWGDVTHIGVHDAATHDLLLRAEGGSAVVRAGGYLLIPPGKLRITADDFHR